MTFCFLNVQLLLKDTKLIESEVEMPVLSCKKMVVGFHYHKKIATFAGTFQQCPDGGIGRRAGLKHQWIHFHAGSIPALGTGEGSLSPCNQFGYRDFLITGVTK
ncbi:MAG: hypothetical protein JG761_148 [Proteiniphilum sp.]|nr:hypothetical protein [Proteiniphilum sp.]